MFPSRAHYSMIRSLIHEYSDTQGSSVPDISLVDGKKVGALGVYLLKLKAKGEVSTTLVYQDDVEKLERGELSDRLSMQLHLALLNLNLRVQRTQ